jgi:hypothetical protein
MKYSYLKQQIPEITLLLHEVQVPCVANPRIHHIATGGTSTLHGKSQKSPYWYSYLMWLIQEITISPCEVLVPCMAITPRNHNIAVGSGLEPEPHPPLEQEDGWKMNFEYLLAGK